MSAIVLTKLQSWNLDSWDDDVDVPVPVPTKLQEWNLTSWEDEVPEVEVKTSAAVVEVEAASTTQAISTGVIRTLGHQYRYAHFVPSLKTTVLKTMFPKSQQPLSDFKKNMSLEQYILSVRNEYVLPVYYVLRSTRFFNPIAKKIVNRSKKEYMDPNNKWVTLEDQRKVYQLFGFSGTSQHSDDILREEIQEFLKNILFQPTHLCALIVHMIQNVMQMEVNETEILEKCQELQKKPEFSYKSYKLPEKWFYDSTWKKIKEEIMIGGGEGGRGAVEQAINN